MRPTRRSRRTAGQMTLRTGRAAGISAWSLAVLAPTAAGGHPEYVTKLLRAIVGTGSSPQVVWPITATFPDGLITEGFDQPRVLVDMPDRASVGSARWLLSRLSFTQRHDLAFLRWFFGRRDIDVLLIEEIQRFTLPLIVMTARLKRVRSVVHLHNVRRHDYTGGPLDRLDMKTLGWALRKVDSVVVHAPANARQARGLYGVEAVVVPHGIDPVITTVQPPPQKPTYLFFGVNRPNKGLSVLVEAVKASANGEELRVAGFTAKSELAATTALLGQLNNVSWTNGFIPAEQVSSYFQEVTAVVLPYTAFDAQSGVLHLAIEHCVPVIASDVGGVGEAVTALGVGLVVPPSNASALAAALRRMSQDHVNAEFRKQCLAAQAQLSWKASADGMLAALRGKVSRDDAGASED